LNYERQTYQTLTMAENQNKNSRIIILVLLVLLIGAAGMLYFQKKAKDTMEADLTTERDGLKMELAEMVSQYDALIEDNDSINRELLSERDRIVALMDSIDQLNVDVATLRRYRNEVYRLKKEKKQLLERADSLIVVNKQLAAEKKQVENQLAEEQVRNENLEEENARLDKTVEEGKRILAYEIITGAVKLKGDKEKETDKVNKADKFKSCFVLSKNTIADRGEKTIYIRLLDPQGNLIGKSMEEYAVEVNGENIVCSEKQSIFYENEKMDMCIYVDTPVDRDLEEGVYTVEIYMENMMIGSSQFELDKGWF